MQDREFDLVRAIVRPLSDVEGKDTLDWASVAASVCQRDDLQGAVLVSVARQGLVLLRARSTKGCSGKG